MLGDGDYFLFLFCFAVCGSAGRLWQCAVFAHTRTQTHTQHTHTHTTHTHSHTLSHTHTIVVLCCFCIHFDVTLYARTRNILLQVLLDKFANRNETPDPSPVSSERGALRTEEGTIIVMSVGGEAQLTQGMAPGSLRTANLVTDKMPQLNLVRRQWSSPPSSHSPASPRASAASAARTPPPSTGSTDDRNAEDLVPVKSMGKVTPGGGVTITPSVPEWAETIDSPDGEEGENPKGLC